jgi:hypothetical protein
MTQWPPWKASSPAEQRAMIDFVVAELLTEDEHAEALIARWDGTMPLESVFRSELNAAKQYARRGNLAPLREILSGIDPELVEFIHEPPRVRGQRRPRLPGREQRLVHDEDAGQARDIGRVRAIWQRQYGRWKRHAGDGPSAEDIVDAYHAIFDGAPLDSAAGDDDDDRLADTVSAK